MNNKILLAVFFGAVVGCVANEAVRVQPVTAQAAPGQFRECVSYQVGYDDDPDDLAGEATPIPAGWTPVGGAGPRFAVILCR